MSEPSENELREDVTSEITPEETTEHIVTAVEETVGSNAGEIAAAVAGDLREEETPRRKAWKRLAVTTAVLLLVVLAMLLTTGAFGSELTTQERVKKFSDAFFTVGGLTLCFGLLMWVAGEGTFDMLKYGIRMLFRVRFHEKNETYAEYRERKRGKRGGTCLYAVVPGALLTAVAVVLAVVFEYV